MGGWRESRSGKRLGGQSGGSSQELSVFTPTATKLWAKEARDSDGGRGGQQGGSSGRSHPIFTHTATTTVPGLFSPELAVAARVLKMGLPHHGRRHHPQPLWLGTWQQGVKMGISYYMPHPSPLPPALPPPLSQAASSWSLLLALRGVKMGSRCPALCPPSSPSGHL